MNTRHALDAMGVVGSRAWSRRGGTQHIASNPGSIERSWSLDVEGRSGVQRPLDPAYGIGTRVNRASTPRINYCPHSARPSA